ncbi:MIP/aquaporin family protein [Planctomicrobium piriforme]|uniref:Aquaporin Z n=1 Tax=Planctomicrobium piriforme TaxID=1576369 RepID=A0A1I3LAR9_9PLAN|nr:aquaporin [Planctomicrobium piriforme]SFI81863.1 aquaporin Z [Planctomicrobium piriforme]
MRRLTAEFLGAFAIVFMGTGAAVVNHVSGGDVTHVGVSLVFGLVVMAMIYALGDISGAHMNPAVSIAFWADGRFQWQWLPGYITAQIFGALFGSVLLRIMFWDQSSLGETLPAGPWWQSFIFEAVMTFILMLVVLCVSTGAKEKGIMAGAAIGAVIAFEALCGGPISGASMNPARSLAPALVTMKLQYLWVYLLAPTLGALLAVPVGKFLQPKPQDDVA